MRHRAAPKRFAFLYNRTKIVISLSNSRFRYRQRQQHAAIKTESCILINCWFLLAFADILRFLIVLMYLNHPLVFEAKLFIAAKLVD
jgi:hypothetical protein